MFFFSPWALWSWFENSLLSCTSLAYRLGSGYTYDSLIQLIFMARTWTSQWVLCFTLWWVKIAFDHDHFCWLTVWIKRSCFHSHVSCLPQGISQIIPRSIGDTDELCRKTVVEFTVYWNLQIKDRSIGLEVAVQGSHFGWHKYKSQRFFNALFHVDIIWLRPLFQKD